MCSFYYNQFKSVELELQTVDIEVSPEQIRLDAAKLLKFRNKLIKQMRPGVISNSITFETALAQAKALQWSKEFKDVKSIQNMRMSELWWKKFQEKCVGGVPDAVVIDSEDSDGGAPSVDENVEQNFQHDPVIIEQAD